MQLDLNPLHRRRRAVSILTRSGDRVQRESPRVPNADTCCFNPHPVRRPGATITDWHGVAARQGFNPHPVRRPGATRSFERKSSPEKFQSSPGPETGCNQVVSLANSATDAFQSSPGPETGCNTPRRRCGSPHASFNPHPVRRPGATRAIPPTQQAAQGFNPHPVRRPGATDQRFL